MGLVASPARRVAITLVDALLIVTTAAAIVIALGGRTRVDVAGELVVLRTSTNLAIATAVLGLLRLAFGYRMPPLPLWSAALAAPRFAEERARIATPAPLPRSFFLYAAAVVLAPLVWLAPHVLHPRLVPDPGDPLFSAWRLASLEHQIAHDPLHPFDANTFYPARGTLTYSDATVLEGLVAAPFIAAGVDPLLVSNWLFLLAFPLSGLTFFYAGWRLTSDLRAGFVAGVLGALYPFHTEHYSHLELQFFCFVPLAVWTLLRMIAAPGWRTGLAFGIAVAAQWLACMYFGVMLMTFLAPFGLLVLAAWRVPLGRPAVGAALAAAIPIVGGLMLLGIPYMASRGARGDRGFADLTYYSAVPADYGHPHGRLATYRWISRRGHQPEREMFPGAMPIVLAAVGIWPPLRVAQAATLASGALAFDWSIGIHGLTYDDLYRYVLPYRGLRVPARFSAIVGSALVLLSAFGCSRLIRLPRAPRAQSALFAVIASLALINLRPVAELHPYYDTNPSIYARVTSAMVLAELPRTHVIDYMYFSTSHWARLLGGYSGFMPIDDELERAWEGFPAPAALDVLRRRGATHLTYNCAFERSPQRCAATLEHLEENPRLELLASEKWQGGDVRLYGFK